MEAGTTCRMMDDDYVPLGPEQVANPYPLYARARAEVDPPEHTRLRGPLTRALLDRWR